MSLFLFLKQIVDMLYPYQWLDYAMVLLVILLLIYQILLVRPSVRENAALSDAFILAAVVLLTLSFWRDRRGYAEYVKVLSALLMYFVGRVYYDRIKECYGALVAASYVVVFLNFAHRAVSFGASLFQVKNAQGDLYYYDTDMAFAMILAAVFIAMFGKNTLVKYITILFICPYMVICSDAGIQKALLAAVCLLMLIYIAEQASGRKKAANFLLAASAAGMLALAAVLLIPVFREEWQGGVTMFLGNSVLSKENMLDRYETWREIWGSFRSAGPAGRIFGISLYLPGAGSLYLKTVYSAGYAGVMLLLFFLSSVVYYVVKIKDRKTFYVTILLAVMLLGTGITVNSLESTQMSWFPLMFAGMVISSVKSGGESKGEDTSYG